MSLEKDLESKVRNLSQYFDDETIAKTLKITPEAVRDILEGKADIQLKTTTPQQQIIHVNSRRLSYRQRVISVWRTKGGVGCTAVALGLSLVLKNIMNTLLIDLNLADGGSDLSYYLDLPEYPHMGEIENGIYNAVVEFDPALHVLQMPRAKTEITNIEQRITEIMNAARRDYDAIILDLPNNDNDYTLAAVESSNTIVFITGGSYGELVRAALITYKFPQKEVIVVANRCSPKDIKEVFKNNTIIKIPEDREFKEQLQARIIPKHNCTFIHSITKVKSALYESERQGLFSNFFKRK